MAPSASRPQRTCLGCRQSFDQTQLVRYVLSPEREVVVDYRQKLPGRGGYTCIDPHCLRRAAKQQQFARAFRGQAGPVDVAGLEESLVAQVRGKINDLLGMSRKAGQTVSGGNLVAAALEQPGELGLVLLASDISPGIAAKVERKAMVRAVPCYCWLDKGLMGQLLGRAERSVVALRAGRFAEMIQVELQRYMHLVGES